jgi:hypothetical protein
MSEEHSWSDCIELNKSRKVSPDHAKARSLVETAHERLAFANAQSVTEQSANFIFENMYSSLLEVIHAHCVQQGFNVTNHLCIGFFLRDVLKRDDIYRKFDTCRYRRNGIVYYGKRMDFETAKESIALVRLLIKELQ